MANPLEANLNSIARGGAGELFLRELQRVVENIKDPNTDAKKKRRISLNFDYEPYADRSGAEVHVSVETKLQAPEGVSGSVYIGRDGARFRAYTNEISQGDLFEQDKDKEEQRTAPSEPPTTRPQ